MKNRICLILPYIGEIHNYFELFLHSIYKNKDILDLLILIPDSDSFLKTEINCKIPENVIIQKTNFFEASLLFQDKLSSIFDFKLNLISKENLNIFKKPWNLCHYRGLYNMWCKDFLKNYSHWGWIDCDLILGNILNFYPNIFDLNCATGAGHLNIFRNEELPEEAYGKNHSNEWMLNHYEKAYNYFCKGGDNKFVVQETADEGWMIRTFTSYYKNINSKLACGNTASLGVTPGMNFSQFVYKNNVFKKFVYENGNLFVDLDKEYIPILYAHLMRRTKLCKNLISFKSYKDSTTYSITPPLNFE